MPHADLHVRGLRGSRSHVEVWTIENIRSSSLAVAFWFFACKRRVLKLLNEDNHEGDMISTDAPTPHRVCSGNASGSSVRIPMRTHSALMRFWTLN